jgi:hypothetical protein
MGKKRTYRFPEHEQQHNRVDIFRTIQMPQNVNSSHSYVFNAIGGQGGGLGGDGASVRAAASQPVTYINDGFMSSTYDLYRQHQHLHNNNNNNNNNNKHNNQTTNNSSKHTGKDNSKQMIWSTQANTNSGLKFLNNRQNELADLSNNELNSSSFFSQASLSKNKKIIITVLIITFVILAILAIGLPLGLTILKARDYMNISSSTNRFGCTSDFSCNTNEYCIYNTEYDTNMNGNASCLCKPGYAANMDHTKCIQTTCFTGFSPYTYLNDNQSPQTPYAYDTRFIKPYCCPNDKFLTNACCGVSMSNFSMFASKRIIGGSNLALGIFPW